MRWSLRIGRLAGIGIYIHWTFLILIAWIVFMSYSRGGALMDAVETVVFVLAIFGCVVLHELGHALAARRYGIPTRDITLLPIGGVARLERMPEEPTQELVVAVAGPAVNVVIAALLYVYLRATGGLPAMPPADAPPEQFVTQLPFLFKLMLVNIFLVLFNILPAFPMDGGRILRAVLGYLLAYPVATRIAARVGQGMAILFAVFGLFYNPFLLLIALFVFLGAEAEAQMVQMRSAFTGLTVHDGMMVRFRVLAEDDTLAVASEELLAGSQQDFPVVDGDRVVGILPRNELLKALTARGLEARVGDAMRRDCPSVREGDALESVFRKMNELGCSALPVVRAERLVGLITFENIGELTMIRSALRQQQPQPAWDGAQG